MSAVPRGRKPLAPTSRPIPPLLAAAAPHDPILAIQCGHILLDDVEALLASLPTAQVIDRLPPRRRVVQAQAVCDALDRARFQIDDARTTVACALAEAAVSATALSDVFTIDVVEQIRALTGGVTDKPRLGVDRWEQMVRRAAVADAEIARAVARVDRKVSLRGLAARFRGEAARTDQYPPLRALVDRLVEGNGRTPTNDEIDRAVDEAAAWSHRARRRAEIIQVAVDTLPTVLGIDDARWASAGGPAKKPEGVALVPVEAFARWVRHAAVGGDLDALVQGAWADDVALDLGKYSAEVAPVPTNSAPTNAVRAYTWLVPVHDHGSSKARASLLLRDPRWRDAIESCPAFRDVVSRIASTTGMLQVS